jgi:hypothetical protein
MLSSKDHHFVVSGMPEMQTTVFLPTIPGTLPSSFVPKSVGPLQQCPKAKEPITANRASVKREPMPSLPAVKTVPVAITPETAVSANKLVESKDELGVDSEDDKENEDVLFRVDINNLIDIKEAKKKMSGKNKGGHTRCAILDRLIQKCY